MKCLTVVVPATTANLGPGFDVLGLALGLHNTVTLRWNAMRRNASPSSTHLRIVIRGEGEEKLPRDKTNLVVRAALEVFKRVRLAPDEMSFSMRNRIPLARGLGSSAAAVVGGLTAANASCGSPLSEDELLRIAAEYEGHADNVAAALMGGLTAAMMTDDGPRAFRLPIRDAYRCIIAVPDFELSTNAARRSLSNSISRADAIYSLSRATVLAGLLGIGAKEGLSEAMKDRLHQPQRAKLIPGLHEVINAAVSAGALGAALSGAGPCVLALVPKTDATLAQKVGCAMVSAFRRAGVSSSSLALIIDKRGARVTRSTHIRARQA